MKASSIYSRRIREGTESIFDAVCNTQEESAGFFDAARSTPEESERFFAAGLSPSLL
jgi:hypothetical protein